MYDYKEMKPKIFSEEGLEVLLKIIENGKDLIAKAGAVRYSHLVRGVSGDTWLALACVDYLVEKGDLRVISQGRTQDNIYVAGHADQ